ncbi:hypothetical protein GCM10023201_17490 [Actinomycetospora corticicola]
MWSVKYLPNPGAASTSATRSSVAGEGCGRTSKAVLDMALTLNRTPDDGHALDPGGLRGRARGHSSAKRA